MLRLIPILLTACLLSSSLGAYTSVTGDLLATLRAMPILPWTAPYQYQPPSQEDLNQFRLMAQRAIAEDYDGATEAGAPINYQVVLFRDKASKTDHIILQEQAADADKTWRGYFVLRRPGSAAVAPILFGAPHARADYNSEKAGFDYYIDCKALAIAWASAHRNNRTDTAPVRNSPRISDMGHVVDSYYQVFHEEMLLSFPELFVVSLHTMEKRTPRLDVSVSNGTLEILTGGSRSLRMADELTKIFKKKKTAFVAKSCQKSVANQILPGITNAQGLLANGSSDPGWRLVYTAPKPERFMHFEQSPQLLVKKEFYIHVISAFKLMFPPIVVTRVPVGSRSPAQVVAEGYESK